MTPLYLLQDIRLARGEVFTLEVDHLEIRRGGLYALLGANGAGKSTLLHLLALLLPPDSGFLALQGEPVAWRHSRLRVLRQQLTFVAQNPYLLSGSVARNLAYGQRCRGIDSFEQQRRSAVALEQVGLAGFETRQCRELSRGEIQRVALARALVLQPQVLLLDEPTANSDQQHQALFTEQILALSRHGVTVVFATHNLQHAYKLNAEIVSLGQGRLVETPSSLIFDASHKQKTEDAFACPHPLKKPGT